MTIFIEQIYPVPGKAGKKAAWTLQAAEEQEKPQIGK